MTLFAAGLAISALLLAASYSRLGLWAGCCSTAMSIAALVGWTLLSTIDNPSQVRTGLMRLAGQLPRVLDQRTLDELTKAIAEGSASSICGTKGRPGCMTAAASDAPLSRDGDAPRSAGSSSVARQAMQAPAPTSRPQVEGNFKEASGFPVAWLLDEPSLLVSPGTAPRFLISGINVSDKTLMGVRGTLKPDSSQRELELSLNVQGNELGDATVIPAGARFDLQLEMPEIHSAKQFGGAIFAFKYLDAGQQKSVIWYLAPATLARLATRG